MRSGVTILLEVSVLENMDNVLKSGMRSKYIEELVKQDLSMLESGSERSTIKEFANPLVMDSITKNKSSNKKGSK